MDRASILVLAHRHLLESYSRRTVRSLRQALPVPLALPWLERLLIDNVAKEVRKDALVISRAAVACAAGQLPDDTTLASLLAAGKEIDRQFLVTLGGAPLTILVHYEQIDPIRLRRIGRLFTAAGNTLDAWRSAGSLRGALRRAYPEPTLEQLVFELLDLYALETKMLGEAVRLPSPLSPLRQRLVGRLYQVMLDVARQLAGETSARVSAKANR